ncbi:MAG: RDD family protein [Haliea sp.]|jgi:uncharacterized RDD family membrane protein YckC|nr:RDD family protein [Haliea sp.]
MDEYNFAGFWIRVAAALIDTVLLSIVIGIPLTLIYGSEYWTSEELVMGFWDAVFYIVPVVITVWFWVKYLGTPGKMLLRLRVIDSNTGQAISTAKGVGRYLGYYVSAIPLLLGFVWVAFDKRKQGFHDKLAGTLVIRDTAREPLQPN